MLLVHCAGNLIWKLAYTDISMHSIAMSHIYVATTFTTYRVTSIFIGVNINVCEHKLEGHIIMIYGLQMQVS